MASSPAARLFTLGLPALATFAVATAAAAGGVSAPSGPAVKIRAFKPVADTYITAAHPRGNYGKAQVLRVDGAPEASAYLRFDLRKLRGNITSVTLLLHPTTAARRGFAVRRVYENAWRERRLTYANAPRPSPRYTAAKPVRRGLWSAIDVTPFVSGSGQLSLAVTTRAAQELSFGSRESTHGPRLVVRTEQNGSDDRLLDALPPH
jgi:hypothetical protein